jgi:putative transposase
LIQEIFTRNKGRYGYRRMVLAIRNETGMIMNHKKVSRLMKECKLTCLVRRKKYKSYRGEVGKVADNLLNRNFYAEQPNEKWVTDVTEFKVADTKVYLSPILDLYNQEIVSYSVSTSPTMKMIDCMIDSALETLPKESHLIIHSDQGWQYQQRRYQLKLSQRNIKQSMSRKGNCLDNAIIENFFSHVKSELYYLQDFTKSDQFIRQLHEYLYDYNHNRIKSKLKGLSPIQYRLQSGY